MVSRLSMSSIYSIIVNGDDEKLKTFSVEEINSQTLEFGLINVAIESNSHDCLYHLLDTLKGGAPQIFSAVSKGTPSPVRLALTTGNSKCLWTLLHILDDEYIPKVVETKLLDCTDVALGTAVEKCLNVVIERIDETRDYDLLTSFLIHTLPCMVARDYRASLEATIKILSQLNDREPEVVDDIIYTYNSKGDTILHQAVKTGNLTLVKIILSMYSELLNTKNRDGLLPGELECTPLIKAYIKTITEGCTPMYATA